MPKPRLSLAEENGFAPADNLKILFGQRDALREENNDLLRELNCAWQLLSDQDPSKTPSEWATYIEERVSL